MPEIIKPRVWDGQTMKEKTGALKVGEVEMKPLNITDKSGKQVFEGDVIIVPRGDGEETYVVRPGDKLVPQTVSKGRVVTNIYENPTFKPPFKEVN